MARKPRIEFPGAIYHVMSRGDHGEAIFEIDEDRERFLDCLGEICERAGWKIHAFVLMTNHYHFLLETSEPNLVAGMKWLQGTYTQRFNRRHGIQGHLFQGRYKAVVMDEEEPGYFLAVSNYIHLNPVRGGLVQLREPLQDYHWSSLPMYLMPAKKRPKWLRVDQVLGELGGGGNDRRGRSGYAGYIEGLVRRYQEEEGRKGLEEEWDRFRRGWCLGREGFRDRLIKILDKVMQGKQKETYRGDEVRAHDEAEAARILRAGLRTLGLKEQELDERAKGAQEKQVLAWWLRKKTVVSREWISQKLKMGDVSRVTQACRNVDTHNDPTFVSLRKRLEKYS
jgi:putative transposase